MALAALTAPVRAAAAVRGDDDDGVRLPAVMYHHISADPARSNDYVITPADFEADLRWLRDNGYESVSVSELLAWERGEAELPAKSVLITFDDAQLSFMLYALPLLERYDMCAVVAVVGAYADEYSANGDTNPAYAYMTWQDVAAAAETGRVEIASHTQDMHSIGRGRAGCRINPGEGAAEYKRVLNADLAAVEASIARATGAKPHIFAYPYGFDCAEAAEVLAGRGYDAAFTCAERVNVLRRDAGELMAIARFNRASGRPVSSMPL